MYLVQHEKTGYYTGLSLDKDGTKVLFHLTNVHDIRLCEKRNCAIHNNPSLHALTMEPLLWDNDNVAVQRECVHGLAHPDPDDLGYRKTVGQYYMFLHHKCDGCCGLELKE